MLGNQTFQLVVGATRQWPDVDKVEKRLAPREARGKSPQLLRAAHLACLLQRRTEAAHLGKCLDKDVDAVGYGRVISHKLLQLIVQGVRGKLAALEAFVEILVFELWGSSACRCCGTKETFAHKIALSISVDKRDYEWPSSSSLGQSLFVNDLLLQTSPAITLAD